MTLHAPELGQNRRDQPGKRPVLAEGCDRVPAIMIETFCETLALSAEIDLAATDRRMSRAVVSHIKGGVPAAIERYRSRPSPNLLIIESRLDGEELLAEIDGLAEVCDVNSRLILVGRSEHIDTYRALMKRGVNEYLRMPVVSTDLIGAVSEIFHEPAAAKVGRAIAFIGARGGVGSSTLAHNVAWTLGRLSDRNVILADLDLQFGTAGLDFDMNPKATIAEALQTPDRLDDKMLERLLQPCGEHFSLLVAPARLDLAQPGEAPVFEKLLELAQSAASHVVVDVPRVWCEWSKRVLLSADEVVITATPDLTSLRNTHNLLEALRRVRPHDADPKIVLNQVGVSKRPEIKSKVFADAVGIEPMISIPSDPMIFGTAANSGRMLPLVPKGGRYLKILQTIAERLNGRPLPAQKDAGWLARLRSRKPAAKP